jgi:hypothetical protein
MPSHNFGKSGTAAAVVEPRIPVSPPPGGDGQLAEMQDSGEARPREFAASELAFAAAASATAPTLAPPAKTEDIRAITSVWVNNQRANALWTINQNRNSWAAFSTGGWQKFANNSDSAIVAFTALAANARDSQGVVNYRSEADNMIHEIYVW